MRVCAVAACLSAACSFSAPGAPANDADAPFADAAIPDAGMPLDGFEVVSLSFRDGAGYQGTRDNWLIEEIDTSRGSDAVFNWDLEHTEGSIFTTSYGESIGLLKFEIFGEGAERVPAGSRISRALLVLVVRDTGDAPTQMFEVSVPWDESTTWATFGAAAGPQAGDDYDPKTALPFETGSGGAVAIDVSASVQRWSDGSINNGWVFRAGSDQGTDVPSRESADEGQRPKLVVEYLIPAPR